ncbi:hypothetical protein [Clostridium sardiniense]|uniref:hypothetical protein n=1 Tax=Clostridium sardiniense TaxID=29369 RepID=UPI00195ED93F|nr:hypothetical protein [Clostridium sardiniense]MBM7835737.1 hypothetical protein [Clostridium sardiniense]
MSYYTQQYNESIPFSNKIKIVESGKRHIVRTINNNQSIVRLCRYLTKTPLLKKGVDYNNNMIKQSDLDCGLLTILKDGEYPMVQSRDRILIPYAFDDSLQPEEQILIFVDSYNAKFNSKYTTGKYIFDIVIAYTPTYNILEPYGEERALKIADQVCKDFDEKYNDEESQKEIGELKFTVSNIQSVKIGTGGNMGKIIRLIAKPLTDRELLND